MDEIITKSKMSRRRFFKRKARKLLFSDWLVQIFAFALVFSVYYGINQFGTAAAFILNTLVPNEKLTILVMALFMLFAVAVLVPLTVGLCVFEINLISGKKCNFSDIFSAFSSGVCLARAFDLFFGMLFRFFVSFWPAMALYVFNVVIYPSGEFSHSFYFAGVDVVMFLLRSLYVLLLFLAIVHSSKGFVALYISVTTDKEIPRCFYEAKRSLVGNNLEAFLLAFSFLPLFVASLFTVGFLFVLYTVPYMFITFTMFAKYIYDKELYSANETMNASADINKISE